MGSLRCWKETYSTIEYVLSKKEKYFLFCEAKWNSDISTKLSKFLLRNQLQRVIESALYFLRVSRAGI